MRPINRFARKVDRYPAAVVEVSGPRISVGIRLQQHRLLVESAGAHADYCPAIAVVIAAELRELLAGDEEGRLAVRQPLRGFGQLERRSAHFLKRLVHLRTNS